MLPFLFLWSLAALSRAHGDHKPVREGTYAEMHMASEHHMDNFDIQSFFHLHDLNRDGVLDQNELESVYGVHHEKMKKSSGASVEVHTEKAKEIVNTVLKKLDENGDGVLTMREFVAGGVDGLPNFEGVEHLGHHYDAEGEYFLHHEEQYHSTPETQNEEDYIHPEDIEHFMNHAKIEEEEEEKVREFTHQELSPKDAAQIVLDTFAAQKIANEGRTPILIPVASLRTPTAEELARNERKAEALKQAEKFGKASREAKKRGDWGDAGFANPRDIQDRLRKDVPWKFKVKKSFWFGEF